MDNTIYLIIFWDKSYSSVRKIFGPITYERQDKILQEHDDFKIWVSVPNNAEYTQLN